ncbi:hypothetical protein E4U39_005281, partial [Claviceps sp. Clav50 group G5]
ATAFSDPLVLSVTPEHISLSMTPATAAKLESAGIATRRPLPHPIILGAFDGKQAGRATGPGRPGDPETEISDNSV